MAFTILNQADAIEDPTAKWPQSEPDARDFADVLAASLNLTGVVSGCAVTAQGTPDMTVAVASGVAVVGGTSATVAAGNVTIGASGANPRFDLICVASNGTKSAVAGTGASNPVFPDPVGKCVLAAVYVPASDTDIDSNQIVDKRVIVKPWVQLAGDTMTSSLSLTSATAGINVLLTGDAEQAALVRATAYGNTSAAAPLSHVLMRRVRGTVAAPLRTKTSDLMGRVGGTGAHAADDVSAATLLTSAHSYLEFRASEAFTSTARGSDVRFYTTPLLGATAAEKMRLLPGGELQLDEIQGYAAVKNTKFMAQLAMTNLTSNYQTYYGRIVRYGGGLGGGVNQAFGVYGLASDHASAGQVTITGAANNGGGLIRITAAAHPFATSDRVAIGNVAGVTNANGAWTITKIDANTFDLQASTFAGTYSGSGAKATSAGVIFGGMFQVSPTVTRVLSSATGAATDGDDVVAVCGFNLGTAKGMEAFYIGRNATNFPSSSEWIVGFAVAGNCDYGFRIAPGATCVTAGIDFSGPITSGDAIVLGSGHNIKTHATTGTKIATTVSEKLAFHGSTAVIQRAGAAQVAVATTGATSTTPFGYTTAAQADAIVTLVNEIRASLVEKGLMKGAA